MSCLDRLRGHERWLRSRVDGRRLRWPPGQMPLHVTVWEPRGINQGLIPAVETDRLKRLALDAQALANRAAGLELYSTDDDRGGAIALHPALLTENRATTRYFHDADGWIKGAVIDCDTTMQDAPTITALAHELLHCVGLGHDRPDAPPSRLMRPVVRPGAREISEWAQRKLRSYYGREPGR